MRLHGLVAQHEPRRDLAVREALGDEAEDLGLARGQRRERVRPHLARAEAIGLPWLADPGFGWLLLKLFLVVSSFLWFRATFPRYRYDQIMRLGWKVFLPLTILWIVVLGAWMQTPLWIWWK